MLHTAIQLDAPTVAGEGEGLGALVGVDAC